MATPGSSPTMGPACVDVRDCFMLSENVLYRILREVGDADAKCCLSRSKVRISNLSSDSSSRLQSPSPICINYRDKIILERRRRRRLVMVRTAKEDSEEVGVKFENNGVNMVLLPKYIKADVWFETG
jgi:hypothetical protein